LLKLKNIQKSFGDREILSDLNLELEKGKTYSLMGSNGAGKTTLFNILTVFLKADVGSYKGPIGGALLLATAQNLSAYYIDSKWMDATAYVILILFLIWKPLGFSGKRLKKVEI